MVESVKQAKALNKISSEGSGCSKKRDDKNEQKKKKKTMFQL